MMIADIIVIALIAFFAYIGYKKGFVKTVSKLCCLIIAVVVAKILHPIISVYVNESALGDFIRNKIYDGFYQKSVGNVGCQDGGAPASC